MNMAKKLIACKRCKVWGERNEEGTMKIKNKLTKQDFSANENT